MLRLTRLCLFSCLLFSALPLYAADFVIEVPIKLQRMMSDVGEVMVTCVAMNEDEDKIGKGRQKVAIEGESYKGKVEVSFDADYGQNPNDATMYTCTMRLRQIAGREYRIPQSEEDEPDWPIWARARKGTDLVYEVKGNITPDQPPESSKPPEGK
jgi:hypothetical protein